MTGYLVRRFIWIIPVILVVTLIVFSVSRVLPGNPVYLILGNQAADQIAIDKLTAKMGLDKPIYVQYTMYLKDLLKGDFGNAWHTGNPVSVDLKARYPATIELALTSLFIAILIGIPLGVFSSVFLNSWLDHTIRFFGFIGLSIPSFWLGLTLSYLLAFKLQLLPAPIGRIGFSFSPPNLVTGFYTIDSLLAGDNPMDVDTQSGGYSAKLDLAHAYIEIDDADSAVKILDEIINNGPDDVQEEAQSLKAKLKN